MSQGKRSAPVVVTRRGHGPAVLLVHGGAGPETTWSALDPLADRFTLVHLYRRGYPPSPPPLNGGQDFAVDADDIAALLDERPHVVAHSYGGAGATLAAQRRPQDVRSLTLVEAGLDVAPGDPEVEHLKSLSAEVLRDGLEADPQRLREFLRLAGARGVDDGPLPAAVARGVERARGCRSPYDAQPDLSVLRAARIPTLVVSGDHYPAIERVCDALAGELDAERLVARGAGHFVAAAPDFAEQLARFLTAVG